MSLAGFRRRELGDPVVGAGPRYGRRYYNAIRMSIYSILTGGIALGPLLAGVTYDATDSYTCGCRCSSASALAGIALFLYAVKAIREPIPERA